MNKEESLALFAQGRDAWNAWTAKMFTEREALEAAGTWTASREKSKWNDATRAWQAAAVADFLEHRFEETVDFSGFVFPGEAAFTEATFSGDAAFSEATFSGDAAFGEATFSGEAAFIEATFSGKAWFGQATFSDRAAFTEATFSGLAWFCVATFTGLAWFTKVTFSGEAWFGQVTFSDSVMFRQAVLEGFTEFGDARFEKAADFCAIEGKSAFSLAGATFLTVPDFVQAHFAEAPRFDDCQIEPRGFWQFTLTGVKAHFKGDRDLSARWRALKRLAVQGHDHMYELEFFQNELKTRRWVTDRPWHAVFWFGLLYGWLSGFGRSVVRPLFWWTASVLAFAPLYLSAHFDHTGKPFSVFSWSIDRFVLQPFGAAVAPPIHCLAGSGDPWRAALGISARKALLFYGPDFSDKLTLNYACLYDVITQQPAPSGKLPASFYLDVPNSVIVFGIVQHIISAVLLFLLLLAIRNQFRIK